MKTNTHRTPATVGRFSLKAFLLFSLGLCLLAPQVSGNTAFAASAQTKRPASNASSRELDFQTQPGPVNEADLSRLSEVVREGDIMFQTTVSRQSLAIKIATQSEYTHCGIVLKKDGKLQVFEAAREVGWTPLEDWVKRGVKHHYVLMRLKDPQSLTSDVLKALRSAASTFAGKEYDLLFQWSDAKMYCSELVWKLYQKAGIELCTLHTFHDYDLNHNAVQKIIKERYGMDMPWDEQVVAPSDLMRCELLEVVEKN